MSARSEDNSLFVSKGREQLTRRSDGSTISAVTAYGELLEAEGVDRVREIVEETRRNWIESYLELLAAIEVPTILFWFSQRAPEYDEGDSTVQALFGEFPQLVNSTMIEQIKGVGDVYVECISSRGFPQPLTSRFTGDPVSVDIGGTWMNADRYYPSPEMHEDAADALLAVVRNGIMSASRR
jgi:hypothetical protein